MAIVAFVNSNKKEKGQSLTAAAVATCMSILHNYKSLLISTDFRDRTLDNSFFDPKKENVATSIFGKKDLSSVAQTGLDGLQAVFASNRADEDLIKNYTRPILNERLDLLEGPKTQDPKEYAKMIDYFSQISEVSNKVYDYVFIDLTRATPSQEVREVLNLATITVVGLAQNIVSIEEFKNLKMNNDFYNKKNVFPTIERYDKESKYSAKNVGRYLGEKIEPYVIPYNILFADRCSEGKIIDYFLSIEKLNFTDGKDGYFYNEVKNLTDSIDVVRKAIENGTFE